MSRVSQTPERLEAEAAAVVAVREQLALLGQNEPEYLDISIESETGFKELVEELLDQEAEADSMIAAIKAREDDLSARRDRLTKRKATIRQFLAHGLELAGLPKMETALGTVSVTRVAPSLIVTDETVIPASYWRRPEPTIDKKALTDALRARAKAVEAAGLITDPAAREQALVDTAAAYPDIPGVTLSNGGSSLSIRRR